MFHCILFSLSLCFIPFSSFTELNIHHSRLQSWCTFSVWVPQSVGWRVFLSSSHILSCCKCRRLWGGLEGHILILWLRKWDPASNSKSIWVRARICTFLSLVWKVSYEMRCSWTCVLLLWLFQVGIRTPFWQYELRCCLLLTSHWLIKLLSSDLAFMLWKSLLQAKAPSVGMLLGYCGACGVVRLPHVTHMAWDGHSLAGDPNCSVGRGIFGAGCYNSQRQPW